MAGVWVSSSCDARMRQKQKTPSAALPAEGVLHVDQSIPRQWLTANRQSLRALLKLPAVAGRTWLQSLQIQQASR